MQYSIYILTKLLQKYEHSKAFSGVQVQRRIAFAPLSDKVLAAKLENVDEKDACLAALQSLARQGIIDYSWQKFETGNLLDKVWLIFNDQSALNKAYALTGIQPKRQLLEALTQLLTAALAAEQLLPWIRQFYKDMLGQIASQHKVPALLPADTALAAAMIKALAELSSHADKEVLERFFSLRCYGNTKYFEKIVKNRLYPIIKQYLLADWPDEVTKEIAFAQVGIVKWPEIMEFCGAVQATLADGSVIDYKAEKFGAYINSKLAATVRIWQLRAVKRVLFIENKANYTWYIETEKAADELVIYHGGQYSPVRGKFFCAISQAAAPGTEFYHWSDIDLGGFLIFKRLQALLPTLKQYRMDEAAFNAKQNYGESMTEAYRQQLTKLLEAADYELFHGVIKLMLASNKRIEQECFLV